MSRVVVGLSGGVDSSVAALLLQKQGHEVIGIYMRNWNDESVTINNECPWIEDSTDAMMIADQLGIPFQVLDFSDAYKDRIVEYMFDEYKKGRTPNPDVLCNREIKFDVFLQAAIRLNADFVATGHYCRKDEIEIGGKTFHRLLSGKDANKDQSYFLCQVKQVQLIKALFPIGELQKSEVRKIAEEAGLSTAQKKDSQGLCFVGKVKLPVFLQQQLAPKKGRVYEIKRDDPLLKEINTGDPDSDGNYHMPDWEKFDLVDAGVHQGAHFYTVGQRRGLGIGGKEKPLFVVGVNTQKNAVYVVEGEDHPALYRQGLMIDKGSENWLLSTEEPSEGDSKLYDVRIRYRQQLRPANVMKRDGKLYLWFEKPQKAITPGQFAAWYEGDILVGSGVIAW